MASLITAPGVAAGEGGICLFRLSAIGDVAHAVALVRTLQTTFPDRPLTWIVGQAEAAVARLVPGIEIVAVNKRRLLQEAWRLRRRFRQPFDVLLHMQISFRANLLSLAVPAPRRIGFDRVRDKEGHGLVINERIAPPPPPGEHVLDGFMRFATQLGAPEPVYRWDLALPQESVEWAQRAVPGDRPFVMINVCASRPVRDWPVDRCSALAKYAAQRHGLDVVLCGGRSERERSRGAAIVAESGATVQNLVGQSTLPQLLALMARTVAVVSPDSGPAHLATTVGTPVIGLYGVSNLQRTGPYLDRRWSVDKRAEAARRLLNKAVEELGWDEPVPGGMDLIQVSDVCDRLDALMAATGGGRRRP